MTRSLGIDLPHHSHLAIEPCSDFVNRWRCWTFVHEPGAFAVDLDVSVRPVSRLDASEVTAQVVLLTRRVSSAAVRFPEAFAGFVGQVERYGVFHVYSVALDNTKRKSPRHTVGRMSPSRIHPDIPFGELPR